MSLLRYETRFKSANTGGNDSGLSCRPEIANLSTKVRYGHSRASIDTGILPVHLYVVTSKVYFAKSGMTSWPSQIC